MRTLIKQGTIVTDRGQSLVDLLIEDGKISRIGPDLADRAHEVIRARGMYVFPGGIDPHVHMHLPTPAGCSADDFYTGSRAALAGGTTTIIDFVTPKRGQSILEALELRKEEAKTALTDLMFHVSPVEFTQRTKDELEQCLKAGVRSYKVYMAYKPTVGLQDHELQQVLEIVGKGGGIVGVHCEMGDEIENLRNRFFYEGNTLPLYHALSRPPHTEADAVKKVLKMAAQARCPLYLVHISTADSLKHIEKAKQNGQVVYAETCPQYLLLNEDKYHGPFHETSPFVISPPLRSKEHSLALWEALSSGVLDAVGTDHCPFTMPQKEAGIKDFRNIPNGAGGVEHRMALLFTYGVLENRITLEQYVDLTSTMPAKIFGLYPQKGNIAIGADADLVIWNPGAESIISAASHHQNCDINIYEGMAVKGCADYLIKGREIVVRKGKIIAKNPGKFL